MTAPVPYYEDSYVRLFRGDAREVLRSLPDGSVHCCVTSPPYFGLRDYGHAEQIGLERSPEEYVEQLVLLFREVRRVLRDDGTLWLNLGDSYAQGGSGGASPKSTLKNDGRRLIGARNHEQRLNEASFTRSAPPGLKPKDLIGVPWRVAFALQQPYYTGSIRDERDRIWLAAMLDSEGCMFIHKRKAGQHNGQGYHRKNDSYGPGVEICNTSLAVVERIAALVGKGSICTSEKGRHGRKQTLYRWNLRTTESRDFVRELYPYLIAKQQQARILYGCPSSGERAEAAHAALIGLHNGVDTDVDFPAPPSMLEPGYYLRSDVIWSKSNPMPESVTDRPTKAHEYLFLLAKSESYFYDSEAVAEPASPLSAERYRYRFGGPKAEHLTAEEANGAGSRTHPIGAREHDGTRNRRTVWTIPTQPFPEAHFAVFPPALVEPCILAGCPVGGTVLDPFAGSGTTLYVAKERNRRAVGIELNEAYCRIARKRLAQEVLPLGEAS